MKNFKLEELQEATKNVLKLQNNIFDDKFYIYDSVNDKNFELDVTFPLANERWKTWGREAVIQLCGGYNDSFQQLCGRKKTITGWNNAIKRLINWATTYVPDKPLSQWSFGESSSLLLAALNKKDMQLDEPDSVGIHGRGVVEPLFLLLIKSGKLFYQGKVNDGISIKFPKRYLQKCLDDTLESHGVTYDEWLKGDGWQPVPYTIAMMFLSYSIDILRSEKTKFIMAYFEHQRSSNKIHVNSIFDNKTFNKYCEIGKLRKKKDSEHYEVFKQHLEKVTGKKLTKFPFDKYSELSDYCSEIYDACLVVFLTLTGIRISEISSIKASDYKKETDGTWVFISDLVKTNFGLSEIRTMSGLVAEAADILSGVSYIDKKSVNATEEISLFSRYFSQGDYNSSNNLKKVGLSKSAESLRNRLKVIYVNFCSDQSNEVLLLQPDVHPHQFRHTWVEFAIRKFDGNVLEAIRQHFRHRAGSYHTRRYTDNKLNDEVKEDLERSYIKELIERMALSESGDFAGPVAMYVKRQVRNSSIIEPIELEEFIDDISEEYESVIGHEYGICLVRKSSRHLAKCLDKKTGLPILKNGCFKLCSGCINFACSSKSHKENIERIAISHSNMIENYPLKATKSHKISEQILINAEQLIKVMEINE